jgi:hypothetical protein
MNAHPCIAVILAIVFKLIVAHRFVPNECGIGTIILLIRDKSRDSNDPEKYRAITIIPFVCKVFERCIFSICEHLLFFDQLQFGLSVVLDVQKPYSFFEALLITSLMQEVLFTLLLYTFRKLSIL